MDKCPVCLDGTVLTKLSSKGEESYCTSCRKIIASASLGFVFTADKEEGVQECRGPEGDPRPGLKGQAQRPSVGCTTKAMKIKRKMLSKRPVIQLTASNAKSQHQKL